MLSLSKRSKSFLLINNDMTLAIIHIHNNKAHQLKIVEKKQMVYAIRITLTVTGLILGGSNDAH
jgi:hypothetical protein